MTVVELILKLCRYPSSAKVVTQYYNHQAEEMEFEDIELWFVEKDNRVVIE